MRRDKRISTRARGKMIEESKELREQIFKRLCDHVAGGYSLDCFAELSLPAIKNYLQLYKNEFVQEELDEAMRKGKHHWESIGKRQAEGSCLGNSRSWYYNMANRFGWREKIDIEAEHKGQVQFNVVSYASTKTSDSDVNSSNSN